MQQFARPDAELVELAQAGWGPAFAVLVHRHGPAVLAACADSKDPWQDTLDVFARALRKLHERDPDAEVLPWLLSLAGRPAPDHVPEADPEDLDALWLELDARWPDGRLPRRTPKVLRRTALLVGLLAVGILVPAAVFASGETGGIVDTELDPIRAFPIESEEEPEEEDVEPLPDFELPEVGPADEPVAPPTVDPDPTPDPPATTPPPTTPAPTPPPPPPPPPEPDPEPDPPTDGTPIDPAPTDDGSADDGTTDGTTDGAAPPPPDDGGATDGDDAAAGLAGPGA
ncbi:hypothetical protein FTX61_16355 [Nitriliruptoraceae bacterium ZYF776]|nr:hypothetical protein [Profundirhabdus halotolerans]